MNEAGGELATKVDSAGSVVARFVYARGANVPELMVKGGAEYRIVTGHLGSPRVVVVDSATGVSRSGWITTSSAM